MDYPIVFIPGLFGSLGDDIIPGTGKFSFGFVDYVYRPFIEILNAMGYVEGEDLFISYYDWRKSVLESVNKYLLPDIEKVKMKTGADKVILIAHSLGGLLGRAYMSYFEPFCVDKLIMIGTPNLGSVNSYYSWSGGDLYYSKLQNNIIYNGIKVGFALYYRLFHNIDYIDAVRNLFPVAKDLLPSYIYGNYLILDEDGINKEIPIKDMSIDNSFLNLMEAKCMNINNIFTVSGSGIPTNEKLFVNMKNMGKNKWVDGRPIKSYKTLDGDGTVTTTSSLGNFGTNNIILQGSHTSILHKSKDYLSFILEKPLIKEVEEKKIEKVYIILAQDCEKINVKTSMENQISSKEINIIDSRVKALNLDTNNFWIMVMGDKDLDIHLDVEEIEGIKPRIYMSIMEEN